MQWHEVLIVVVVALAVWWAVERWLSSGDRHK